MNHQGGCLVFCRGDSMSNSMFATATGICQPHHENNCEACSCRGLTNMLLCGGASGTPQGCAKEAGMWLRSPRSFLIMTYEDVDGSICDHASARSWYKVGTQLARSWYEVGNKLVTSWYQVGTKLVQRCSQVGTKSYRSLYHTGTEFVQVGTRLVPSWD